MRPDDVVEGDRLLVDLLDNHERLPVFQREFPGFRQAVRERNAYLAVVMPHDRPWRIEPELRSSLVPLGRPDEMAVLYRHLHADDIEYEAGARHVEVETWASRVPMRDIASMASNVAEARDTDPSALFVDWFERAWNAPETASKVADEIRSYREKRLLPLMLATAIFEGCAVETVFGAELKLLEMLEYPPGEVHELDRPDVADRLQAIAAQTGPNRRIRFVAPGHGPAALKHFWSNYPGLRDNLRDWVIACGGVDGLDGTDWRSTARRFAEQCLRVGRPEDLIRAADKWATSYPEGRAPAEVLLVCGLRDPGGGRRVRQQFYNWSKLSGLHPNLAYLVVALCVQEIEPDRPGEALTRLHHLYVHNSDAGVSRSAGDVLVKLAGNAGFLRRLLYRLAEAERDRMVLPQNHDLFLRTADPTRLIDTAHRSRPLVADPVVRSQLVTCWRYVLAARRSDEYKDAVRTWLTVHAHGDGTDLLIDVLVEACDGTVDTLSALFEIGLLWQRESAGDEGSARRVAAFRRLNAAIDRARAGARGALQDDE